MDIDVTKKTEVVIGEGLLKMDIMLTEIGNENPRIRLSKYEGGWEYSSISLGPGELSVLYRILEEACSWLEANDGKD